VILLRLDSKWVALSSPIVCLLLLVPPGVAQSAERATEAVATVKRLSEIDVGVSEARLLQPEHLAGTAFSAGTAIAQAPVADTEEEITVTAEKADEPPVPEYVPQSGVQRSDFENRNNRRLGDIIERLPGVTVDGPPGENKDVRLRGLDKEFTRTQIDGLTLPDGGEKREFQADRLPSSQVESVTIIRNPTAEFESDGIAGRIDVKTRSVPEKFFFEGRAGLGDQRGLGSGIFDFSVGIGDRPTSAFGYSVGVNILHRRNTIAKPKVFSTRAREDESELLDQRYRDYTFSVGFPYKNGELSIKPTFLNLDLDKEKTKTNINAAGRVTQRNFDLEAEERATRGVIVTHQHKFGGGVQLDTQLGLHSATEDKDKDKREFTPNNRNVLLLNKTTLELEDKKDSTFGLKTALTVPIDAGLKQEIKVGAAMRLRDRERLKSVVEINNRGQRSDKTGPKDNYQIDEDYFAAFIQNRIFLGDRFSILPGIRFEQVNLESSDTRTRDASSKRTDWNPSLHLFYNPTDKLNFVAAVSRGVNRPKFDELSPFETEANDKFTIGNPNLNPATSLNLDIGGKFEDKHFTLGANYFYRNIKDAIEEVDTGRLRNRKRIFQVENVGDGWTGGVELEQRLNLGFAKSEFLRGFTVWGNQTFLNSELTDKAGVTRPFKEQPKFINNLGLDYTYAPWGTTLSLAWTYVGDRVEGRADGSTKTITPFSFLSLALKQKLGANFGLFFEVSNLTNAKKEEREQFLNGSSTRKTEDPGQTFLIGLDWKF
jgi:outer membrane receptor for ferrienterochelin and colicin